MKTLEITLVRSAIGILPNQRKTLEALGLHKRLKTVVKGDTPTIRGMIKVVEHLVTVSER